MKDGRTDGRQEVEVLMALVVMEAEVPGAGERPQALFTQVYEKYFWQNLRYIVFFVFARI